MSYGKTIELFLVDGNADGIVTAELSNWSGFAVKLPRNLLKGCSRTDIRQPGVYFLIGEDEESGKPAVYIGESECLYDRLIQHLKDDFFWKSAIMFFGNLNKAHIRYLENKLAKTARECKRSVVTTQKTYETALKESQAAAMDEFTDNIKVLLSALGYDILEPLANQDGPIDDYLFMKMGKVNAKAKITADGFIVFAGASLNEKVSPKSTPQGAKLRAKYDKFIDKDKWITTEDLLFSSPSGASDFLAGYANSGLVNWKNSDGKSMKDLEV